MGHMNRTEDRNHKTDSKDAQTATEKIQYTSTVEVPSELDKEERHSNTVKPQLRSLPSDSTRRWQKARSFSTEFRRTRIAALEP